ncbi:MAG: sensor histidine kinase [Suipraeoptans sp.]
MFISYLKENLKHIVMYLVFSAIFAVVFYFYDLELEPVLYAFLLFNVVAAIYAIYRFVKFKLHHQELLALKDKLPTELSNKPIPVGKIEEEYREILDKLNDAKIDLEYKSVSGRREMMDYYSMWVHQIKVPISSMKLVLQSWNIGDDNCEHISELKISLIYIEQYVDMVLSYLRMESDSTDYVFNSYELNDIVKESLKPFSAIFVSLKLSLDYKPVNTNILTDKKWCIFVLKQVISNALKYTKSGGVAISLVKKVIVILLL